MRSINVQVRRIPEMLAELVGLCKNVEALFIRFGFSIKHAQTHKAKTKAIDLRSVATQLSYRKRHCEGGAEW